MPWLYYLPLNLRIFIFQVFWHAFVAAADKINILYLIRMVMVGPYCALFWGYYGYMGYRLFQYIAYCAALILKSRLNFLNYFIRQFYTPKYLVFGTTGTIINLSFYYEAIPIRQRIMGFDTISICYVTFLRRVIKVVTLSNNKN